MKGKCYSELSELDAELVLMRDEVRQCSGCGADTWWRGRRQPKRGTCLDCAGVPVTTGEVDRAAQSRAERLIRTAFPGSEVDDDPNDSTRPRWMLLRLWWPVDQVWDQKWIWVRPCDVERMRGSWTH